MFSSSSHRKFQTFTLLLPHRQMMIINLKLCFWMSYRPLHQPYHSPCLAQMDTDLVKTPLSSVLAMKQWSMTQMINEILTCNVLYHSNETFINVTKKGQQDCCREALFIDADTVAKARIRHIRLNYLWQNDVIIWAIISKAVLLVVIHTGSYFQCRSGINLNQ